MENNNAASNMPSAALYGAICTGQNWGQKMNLMVSIYKQLLLEGNLLTNT